MVPELKLVGGRARGSAPAPEFAAAMSELASGVVLVTSRVGGRPWGTTVTAFTSVSADPPTILVSLCTELASARAIAETGRFGVSVLADEHEAVARYGAVRGATKFLEPFADPAGGRCPVVAGALAHLDCEVSRSVVVADHLVFFGRVLEARTRSEGTPLLYHRRTYSTERK
jgi:flavin reductase (DIM6/NTAB) family NADH-FMN oxidoreductase RutF